MFQRSRHEHPKASHAWSASPSPGCITLAAERDQEPGHIGLPVIDSAYVQQVLHVGGKLLVCKQSVVVDFGEYRQILAGPLMA